MKNIYAVVAVFIGVISILSTCAVAADATPDVTKILEASDSARGNSAGLSWDVHIEVTGSNPSTRDLNIKAKNENSLATFLAPSSVKGQMLLMKKNNMWFIKPELSKPISISPRQRLIGGAANADIASTNYARDYDATITGDEDINGTPCYVMDLKGKTKDVTYASIKYWVSKDKNLGLKSEYYSVSGKLLKTATFKYDISVTIDGKEQPFVSEMSISDDLIKDSVTVMSYKNVSVKDIPSSTFSVDNLMF